MTKRVLCIAGLLFAVLLCVSGQIIDPEWAAQQQLAPDDSTWQADVERLTLLDTTIVYKINKEQEIPVKVRRPGKLLPQKEKAARVSILFRNSLSCTYERPYEELSRELTALSPRHIYNCLLGDIVVVRVLLRPNREPCIVEFVDNLSAR